jgi:hypothetical protein
MRALIIVMCVLCLASEVCADVIATYKLSVGYGGTVAFDENCTYHISGDKNYETHETTVNLEIPGYFWIDFKIGSANIVRLDQDVRWTLNDYRGAYSASDLISPHMPDEKIFQEMANYNWSYKIAPIEKQKKMIKMLCNGQTGTALGASKSDPADTIFITYERWSPVDTLIGSEITDYQLIYSKKVGVHKLWALEVFASYLEKRYSIQLQELSNQLDQLKGFPIKSVVTVERSINTELKSDSTSHKTKKSDKEKPQKNGRWLTITVTNEVTKLEQKPIDDSKFEIPTNYKKETE